MGFASGWHEVTKNEVADAMVEIAALDYVQNFKIPSIAESYKVLIVIGYDEEGNPIFLTDTYDSTGSEEESEELDGLDEIKDIKTDEGVLVEYEEGMLLDGLDYSLMTMRQVTYSASCHISRPVEVDPDVEGDTSEEGGAQ